MPKIPKNHNLYLPNPGMSTITKDFQSIEWGKEQNASWLTGKSSYPIFFTAEGHTVSLQDMAKGASIVITTNNFIKCATKHNMSVTRKKRGHYQIIFDHPSNVGDYIINNPSTMKFAPLEFTREKTNQKKYFYHSPCTFYFRRHKVFNPASFWLEETIWNDRSKNSEILSAIKIAHVLGYRTIFINSLPNDEELIDKIKQISQYDNVGIVQYGDKIEGIEHTDPEKCGHKVF